MSAIVRGTFTGTAYEAGLAHGKLWRDSIRSITAERMGLLADPYWTQGGVTEARIRSLGEACLEAQRSFDPVMAEELEGIAAGAGIDVVEALIMNGFTDFVDTVFAARGEDGVGEEGGGCTAVLVGRGRSGVGKAFFAQTWDMHPTATEHVRMVTVERAGEPRVSTFTLAGCVGMIGMNEAGVCVGINNVLVTNGGVGVTWVFVVRAMLRETTVEGAMSVLRGAGLAGAHNYLVLGPTRDGGWRGWNVEATPGVREERELGDLLFHTNHWQSETTQAVQRVKHPTAKACSATRLGDVERLVGEMDRVDTEALKGLLAYRREDGMGICHDPLEGYKVETSGAVVMDPAERMLWACWGRPDGGVWEGFALG